MTFKTHKDDILKVGTITDEKEHNNLFDSSFRLQYYWFKVNNIEYVYNASPGGYCLTKGSSQVVCVTKNFEGMRKAILKLKGR